MYGCQFLFLFLGVLMSSPRGAADLKSTLEVTFFCLFAIAGFVCILYIKKNVVRYRSVKLCLETFIAQPHDESLRGQGQALVKQAQTRTGC